MLNRLQPTDKALAVNGLRIHYLEWGRPEAPPVVCVHGYTSSGQAFSALARRLYGRYRLICPDVRGHGESALAPAGAFQYADQAGAPAGVCDPQGKWRF